MVMPRATACRQGWNDQGPIGIGIPIVALGWLHPMFAGVTMASTTLTMMVNFPLRRRFRAA
jgi:cation transport ATPase